MLPFRRPTRKLFILAAMGLSTFIIAHVPPAQGAESGCVTCHLDKEMLKKNVTAQAGQKSAMQSGAG
jgi:hypothetical protein